MKQHLGFVKDCLLRATPAIAGSMVLNSPSQAATIATAEAALEFTNFSQSPVGTRTVTETNAFTVAQDGIVRAEATAVATFIVAPPEASNLSMSEALGEGRNYLGLAESEAAVVGSFVVDADTTFGFDFTAALDLNTSIDAAPAENARASGDIFFALVDTTNNSILESFSLLGSLNTESNGDILAVQISENIDDLSIPLVESNVGGEQESVTAVVQGSVERSFDEQTNLTLVEFKNTEARVTAPEPSTNIALLISSGLVGLGLKRRRQ